MKVLRDTCSGAKDCSLADSSAVEKIAVERTYDARKREVVVKASQDRMPAAVARRAREDFIVAICRSKICDASSSSSASAGGNTNDLKTN